MLARQCRAHADAPMRAISYCRAADFAEVAAAVGRALENDAQVSYADIEAADVGTGSLSAPGFLCARPALASSHELLLLRSAVQELTQELQATRERLWEREAELASVYQWVDRLPKKQQQSQLLQWLGDDFDGVLAFDEVSSSQP